MKFGKTTSGLTAAFIAVAVIASSFQSKADVTYGLDVVFDGANPGGTAPWLTATFADLSPGAVKLTMQVDSSVPSTEYVDKWYFNFASSASPLSFTRTNSSASVSSPAVFKGNDSYQPDGGGYFDFYFDFSNTGSGKFQAGESITYLITGVAGLNASMFNYLSFFGSKSDSTWFTAAQMNGIPGLLSTCTTTFGIIGDGSPNPAPEPATMAILGSFITFAIYLKRRQDIKTAQIAIS